MPALILIRLDCQTQEDDTGTDSIEIRVNGKAAWQGEMGEGQQRDLGKITIPFDEQALIHVVEKDFPDGDDNLGTATVTSQDSVAVARNVDFRQDGANYTLWYSVYNPGQQGC